MNIQFLFSHFPFLTGEKMNLSQLYFTDEENLQEILNNHGLKYGSDAHIQLAENAFRSKRYVELGYYKNDEPNSLLGTITIGSIDTQTNSVELEIIPNYSDIQSAKSAVGAVLDFLFSQIEVNKVHANKVNADKNWQEVFSANGFVFEGLIRKSVYIPLSCEVGDMFIYGKLAEEHDIKKGKVADSDFLDIEFPVAFDD